ncbi:tetratricopeptide repeat protein [Streptomyces sp. NPDC015661]|uniref:tetratricopeptide repeat protein n=1 Tax=Streptomyces sp. NPDC015661 TaxID=3364961 RepID=UPI0036FB8EA5
MNDERRALVIASHWDVLEQKDEDRLTLLEAHAGELRDLLLDPARGACVPARGDGLLLNPESVDEVTAALDEAFEDASAAEASLVLAFLGHGHAPDSGPFLFPVRTSPRNPGVETAFDLVGEVGSRSLRHGGVLELTVLIDACRSGRSLLEAVKGWYTPAMTRGRRIDHLTSSDDQVSYGLQFSGALNRVIRNGDIRLDPELRTADVRDVVYGMLRRQVPQVASFDGRGAAGRRPDPAWIALNVAHDPFLSVLAASPDRRSLMPALRHFQPPRELAGLVRLARLHRSVAVVGHMGTGKTTLATALSRTELLPPGEAETAPAVCAVVQLTDGRWASGAYVEQIADQLHDHLPGFTEAVDSYTARVPEGERSLLPRTVALLGGPLSLMGPREPVRIVVDGIEQVTVATSRAELLAELTALCDAAPDWFGLVATVREGVPLPPAWERVEPAAPEARSLRTFLDARQVSADVQRVLLDSTAGNWQLTSVLAEHHTSVARMVGKGVRVVYDAVLAPMREARDGDPRLLDRVLLVLAAAGLGTTLPSPLLAHAAGRPGRPADEEACGRVVDMLVGLVGRAPDPAGTELFGIHHSSLIEYVAGRQSVAEGHRALRDALEIMAPMERHDRDDALHRYAEQAEPEHLWHLATAVGGEEAGPLYDRLLDSLELRPAPEAAVNRARWAGWAERLREQLGADTPVTLRARARAAYWTSKAGAYRRSAELHAELLPDQLRVYGADSPEVLETRGRLAYAAGENGDFARALELHREVLADQRRVLGADDPRTLHTRHHIAYWTGRAGAGEQALRMHQELLPDLERVLEPTDTAVFEERHYIAYWHGALGDHERSLSLHATLLRDRIAVFGEEHEQIVFSRMNICRFLGESGRQQEALDGYRELLPLATRVRGRYHPNTFLVRLNTARFTWELGDAVASRTLHEELLVDQREALGATHPAVMITRYNLVMLKAELGDPAAALGELDRLLEERLARYGNPDHPEVITTRFGRARILARLGATEEAVALLREVCADRARVLGEENPATRTARAELARLTEG